MIQSIIAFTADQFGAVLVLMLVDLVTGIWKSIKTKSELSSFKLRSTINKTILYFLVLLIGGCLNASGDASISSLFTIFICLVECISIIENLSKIFPNSSIVSFLDKLLNNELRKRKTDIIEPSEDK